MSRTGPAAKARKEKLRKSMKKKRSGPHPETLRKRIQQKRRKAAKRAALHPSSEAQSGATESDSEGSDSDTDGEEEDDPMEDVIQTTRIEERVVVVRPPTPDSTPVRDPATRVFSIPELFGQIFKQAAMEAVHDLGPGRIDPVTANDIETREYLSFRAIHRNTRREGMLCFLDKVDLTSKSIPYQVKIGRLARMWSNGHMRELLCEVGPGPEDGEIFAGLKRLKRVEKLVIKCQPFGAWHRKPVATTTLINFPFAEHATLIIIPNRGVKMDDFPSFIRLPVRWTPLARFTVGLHHRDRTLEFFIQSVMRAAANLGYLGLDFLHGTHQDFATVATLLPEIPLVHEVEFVRAIGPATFDALSASPNLKVITTNEPWLLREMEWFAGTLGSGRFPNLQVLRLPIETGLAYENERAITILGMLQGCLEARRRCATPPLRSLERIEFVGRGAGEVDLDLFGPGLKAVCESLGVYVGPRV
ncbi:hypothetical protein RQP46_004233 [Phenoliferia psychrophenolica]